MGKKKIEVKLRLKGVNALMKSPEIQSILIEKGERVREAAEQMSGGGEYEAETKVGKWIALEYIRAKDYKSLKSNLEDNTLLKALSAAKDE